MKRYFRACLTVLSMMLLAASLWACAAQAPSPTAAPLPPVEIAFEPAQGAYALAPQDAMALITDYLAGLDDPVSMNHRTLTDITPPPLWEQSQLQAFLIADRENGTPEMLMLIAGETVAAFFRAIPIERAYLADVNGDGAYDVCLNYSIGSGIVSRHIGIYDPAAGLQRDYGKRMERDYHLTIKDEVLCVQISEYASHWEVYATEYFTLNEAFLAAEFPDAP